MDNGLIWVILHLWSFSRGDLIMWHGSLLLCRVSYEIALTLAAWLINWPEHFSLSFVTRLWPRSYVCHNRRFFSWKIQLTIAKIIWLLIWTLWSLSGRRLVFIDFSIRMRNLRPMTACSMSTVVLILKVSISKSMRCFVPISVYLLCNTGTFWNITTAHVI